MPTKVKKGFSPLTVLKTKYKLTFKDELRLYLTKLSDIQLTYASVKKCIKNFITCKPSKRIFCVNL